MEIPDRLENITAAWLTQAVQSLAPGARATNVELVDAHSGTTGRARLKVAWSGGELPEAVFAKLPPTDPIQRVMAVDTGMGAREARFYHALAAAVPVRVPRPIASHWTEDRKGYLMLAEDLEASGCRFPGFDAAGDVAVARGTIEELARLHAAFWDSPRFATDLAWIEPPMRGELGMALVRTGVADFGDSQPPAFHALAKLYLEHNEALSDRLEEGPPTLLHGDPHLGNLFLDGSRVGFLDWALVSRGPALRDVAYFLGASVATEVRRAEQRDLIARYLAVLKDAGAPAPDFDDAWHAYQLQVTNAWVAATATLAAGARMQSLEIGRRALARANAAIEDLSTAEVLALALGQGP